MLFVPYAVTKYIIFRADMVGGFFLMLSADLGRNTHVLTIKLLKLDRFEA